MDGTGRHSKASDGLHPGETKAPKQCKNASSYSGAGADSDDNLLVMKQTVKLKKLKRRRKKLQ